MKKIAILTSGGDAPGMNACIRAVVRTALHLDLQVMGIRRGYQGLIEDDLVELDLKAVTNIIQRGGTILGSARSKEFMTVEGRQKAYATIQKHGIEGIIVVGGNGTFTGASVLISEYPDISVVGAPSTIDNDLYGTDFTIGYDTAINTAMRAIDNIKDTADSHNRLFFVEVMGRDAGFIAMRSGIATGSDAVLVPEIKTSIPELIEILQRCHSVRQSSAIVVVAEGDDEGDAFHIAEAVKGKVPYHDIRITVLGHIQRGGSPTCMDRVLASRLGVATVKALADGKKGIMIGQQHNKLVDVPFEKSIKHNKQVKPYLEEIMEALSL